MKIVITLVSILVALSFLVWLGLHIRPAPFPARPAQIAGLKTVPPPEGLPAPVERFNQKVYGDSLPLIETVVISGRATIRPLIKGPALPARFIFIHNAGRDYHHYIEATFFGLPFLKVNEDYLDGKSYFESPMGSYYDDPNTNQGANLALWAEAVWFPALWVTDRRARWQPVDDHTARLLVPFGELKDSLLVHFNPHTDWLDRMEARRCREAGTSGAKILWITSVVGDKTLPGN